MLWLRSERQADETEPRGGSGLLKVVLDNDSGKPGRDKTWRQCREGKKQPLKPSLGALLSDGIPAVGAFPVDTEAEPGYKQGGIKKFLSLPVGLLAPTTFNSKVFY